MEGFRSSHGSHRAKIPHTTGARGGPITTIFAVFWSRKSKLSEKTVGLMR